jgi:hypothetical protein
MITKICRQACLDGAETNTITFPQIALFAMIIRGRRLRLNVPILGGDFLCGHLGA